MNGRREMAREKTKESAIILLGVLLLSIYSIMVFSTPSGVTITTVRNTSLSETAGTIANYTGNGLGDGSGGGYIFYVNVTGNTKNTKWKGYVGNVSGKLTLDDSSGFTIYDWSLSSFSGEIYATRTSATINWSGIRCAYFNVTEEEGDRLNHTSKNDNITATFDGTDNTAITVGTTSLASCPTTNIYVNDTKDLNDDFEEVVLYDGPAVFNRTAPHVDDAFSNLVYAQILEENAWGFSNATFDFQIIVPENGASTWASSTAYYFYIELS